MHSHPEIRFLSIVLCALSLIACGGGGGSSSSDTAQTSTGAFKDANVQGLHYTSGGQSGFTDANGRFTYEVGKQVTFRVGGVTVGTTAGAEVVTPVELAGGAVVSSPEVVNRVRFLLALDTDGDPDNGITVSPAVRDAAQDWKSVDFTASDFTAEIGAIPGAVAAANGETARNLPSESKATTHLSATLRCVIGGIFTGRFDGDLEGRFSFVVDPATGTVKGGGYDEVQSKSFLLAGNTPVALNGSRAFIAGTTSGGAEFQGNFGSVNSVQGEWSTTNGRGTFSGKRIALARTPVYRYAGRFADGTGREGVYVFGINESGELEGQAYGVIGDTITPFTGRIENGELQAITDEGSSISADIDPAAGSLKNGTWSALDGDSGTFTGSGCQLN